jgi:hypothetical protein
MRAGVVLRPAEGIAALQATADPERLVTEWLEAPVVFEEM